MNRLSHVTVGDRGNSDEKGYLSPYNLGALNFSLELKKIGEEVTRQRWTNTNIIFYLSAFQAGIDEFVIHEDCKSNLTVTSDFISERTRGISTEKLGNHGQTVRNAFCSYLPSDWERSDRFRSVISVAAFVSDLLEAMSAGASLLATLGMPDIAEIDELMPNELYVPLANLFSTVTSLQTSSPVPQKVFSLDDMQKFNDIISSDLFCTYARSQSTLEDLNVPLKVALPSVVSTGRKLFVQNRNLLSLRKCSVGILQVTPKIVDAVLGKLPGVLAEVAAKLGVSLLETRRRAVIYDFRELFFGIVRSDLRRTLNAR